MRAISIGQRRGLQQMASGILVGRAVWKEAITMNGDKRMEFLRHTAAQRLARLTSLCNALAKPYTEFYQAYAPSDWYRSYGA